MKLKYDSLVKQILAENSHDKDKDGDVDSDDYMKARDLAIKKAMGKKDEDDSTENETSDEG